MSDFQSMGAGMGLVPTAGGADAIECGSPIAFQEPAGGGQPLPDARMRAAVSQPEPKPVGGGF